MIAKKVGHAIHILDRFHIIAYLSKAIDEIRAQEGESTERKRLRTNIDKITLVIAQASREPDGKSEN